MYLFITLCVFGNILSVKSQQLELVKIPMNISVNDDSTSVCKVQEKYILKEGTLVQFEINSTEFINYAWRTFTNRHNRSIHHSKELKTARNISNLTIENFQLKPVYDGYWTFKILSHKNANIVPHETHHNDNYTVTYCIVDITVTPFAGNQKESNMSDFERYFYFGGAVVLIIIVIVIILASIVMYYKSKARAAEVHQNLSVRRKVNDKDRYSVGFFRKPRNRDDGQYETLEEINMQRIETPESPAIDTISRKTDFSDESLRVRNRPPQPLPMEEYEVINCQEYNQPRQEEIRPGGGDHGRMQTPFSRAMQQNAIDTSSSTRSKLPHHKTRPDNKTPMPSVKPKQAEHTILPHTPKLTYSPSTTSNRSLKTQMKLPVFMKPLPPPPQDEDSSAVPRLPAPPLHRNKKVPVHGDEPNSSDDEWTYEELPHIKLSNPVPKHYETQESTHYRNSSDEEWNYEPLPKFNIYNV